ncbi:MAG TPA: hypothetical protein VFE47_31480 [Tepidisphaeraceae bacterium]|nr:hypothetical protein [Tepidisphaeraceae bacterium]
MFWIPRTRELIGLTTNHEFGYWLALKPEKLVYGRPDDAYRCGYLDVMWDVHARQNKYPARPIHVTLEETIGAAIKLAGENQGAFRCKSAIAVESPYGGF